jgi:hypothetical protein
VTEPPESAAVVVTPVGGPATGAGVTVTAEEAGDVPALFGAVQPAVACWLPRAAVRPAGAAAVAGVTRGMRC